MPMVPELAFTMLACARIGAVHSVVFAGFSSDSLADRIKDGNSKWVFTCNEGRRGGKSIPLKRTTDDGMYCSFAIISTMHNALLLCGADWYTAVDHCPSVEKVFVYRHTGTDNPQYNSRDVSAMLE